MVGAALSPEQATAVRALLKDVSFQAPSSRLTPEQVSARRLKLEEVSSIATRAIARPDPSAPKPVRYVVPDYPEIGRQAQVKGVVLLECRLTPQGSVGEVSALKPIPLFTEVAADALNRWEFPATAVAALGEPPLVVVAFEFSFQ